MLDILSNTFRTATRSSLGPSVRPDQSDDTARRYPWRRNRWGNRRHARRELRRLHGMSDEMLRDIGISRNNIERLFD